MSNNREFSQLASNIVVKEGENYIGIATGGTQTVGIGTTSVFFDPGTGRIYAKGFFKDGVEIISAGGGSSGGSITVREEGALVGTAGSIVTLNFTGSLITAIAAENQGIATITVADPTSVPYAVTAGIATYATTAGIATYATTAGVSTYATSAGIATYATTAGVSTYATSAGIATYATTAGIATYATTAGIATYATTAGVSTYATTAGIATYATTAGISTTATTANYATTAGIATYATTAGIATYATTSGIATYATTAGIATGIGTDSDINTVGVVTASKLSTGTGSDSIGITTNTITGPASLTIDPAVIGDDTGAVYIRGDLYVQGSQFQVDSTTINLADKVIGIATTCVNDALLDGAGIGIGSDKTFVWNDNANSLKSSENLDIASGKSYLINGSDVLTSSQVLGKSITPDNTNSTIVSRNNTGGFNAGVITATQFHGDGSNLTNITSSSATNATNATNFNVTANNSTNETVYPVFVDGTTGNQGAETDSGLTYNPSTNTLTVANFAGNATSADSATSATSASSATNATNATNFNVTANNSTNETVYPVFVDGTAGNQGAETDTGLTYNPNTNTLTATNFAGNATSADSASSATSATNATNATNFNVSTNSSNNETVYPVFVDGNSGNQGAEVDTALTYNPSTDTLTAGKFSGDGSGLTGVSGGGEFNSAISSVARARLTSIGGDVLALPSTAGEIYIIHSISASNIGAGNTEVNVIGAFDYNGGEVSYFAYNIPIPTGTTVELLREPQVLNPSDTIQMRGTNALRDGWDDAVEVHISYEQTTSNKHFGKGFGNVAIASTTLVGIHTASANSVVQSIRLANKTDNGAYPVSVSVTSGVSTIYLVDNLIIPKYASVELLDNPKALLSGDIVNIEVDQVQTIDVQISGKTV